VPDHGAPPERVPIGEVTGAHGIRGLVRVRSFNDASDLLASLDEIDLRAGDGSIETHRVTRAAPHGRGIWLVELADVADRTAAEALAGRHVVVAPEALPALAEDEFYHHELVGFSVETTSGEAIGTIAGTLSTGLNDVWIVRDGPRERLVPAIADVVDTIDRAGRRVVIVALEGLLD
jgi:16S rRNA processing protein RimM